MAWIYMVLVIVVFYTPILGLGPFLLQRDFEISVGGLPIPIPFSGSIRLALYSLIAWYGLWQLTHQVEKRFGFDLFYEIDRRLQMLLLRERWLYAHRPAISRNLAVQLARAGMYLSGVYVLIIILLGVILALVLPQLIRSALPNLIEYFLTHFPDASWVESLVRWIDNILIEWLSQSVLEWVRDALAYLLRLNVFAPLLALSVLILIAGREFEKERAERYHNDIKRVQQQRKKVRKGALSS